MPYSLLQYCVRHGEFNLLKVLLCCKLYYGNGFKSVDLPELAKHAGLHQKTVITHINQLVTRRWIGYDSMRELYLNRGWNYLLTVIGDGSTTGYTITKHQIAQCKAFAIAATYDQLISSQQYRKWLHNRERRQKGTSYQTGLEAKGFYPVANKAYATIFDLSEATASRYRKLASDCGFIELKDELIKIDSPEGTKLHYGLMMEYSNEHLIYRDGSYYIQKVTHVRSHMIRKQLRYTPEKSESIRKGNSQREKKSKFNNLNS